MGLADDVEIKISDRSLLTIAHSLLSEKYSDKLNLKKHSEPKDATGLRYCFEFEDFILGAKKDTESGLASVQVVSMKKVKPFIIYFDEDKDFVWFDWKIIKENGFQNIRFGKEATVQIKMWNFRISLGVELNSFLTGQIQQELF